MPFYSWECLTLCLKDREVDLVIPNEPDMERLLKYLIWNTKTIDGCKNSAVKILNKMQKQSTKSTTDAAIQNEHLLFSKVYRKYVVMKVRAKISFMAWKNSKTISELFVDSILKTYQ